MYNNIDISKLFDNESKFGKEYYQGELKENRIKEVENNLGYKLPKSYIPLWVKYEKKYKNTENKKSNWKIKFEDN